MKPPKPKQYTKEEQEIQKQLEVASETYKPITYWTPFQEEMLKKYYGRVPRSALEELLHHCYGACVIKASKLGVKFDRDEH